MQSFQPPSPPPRQAGSARRFRLAAILTASLALSACSVFGPPEQVRGNRVDPDVLAELVPGTSSRADATALLGSPTAKATFDDNVWLYIGSVTKTRVARVQAMVRMDVVKLTFDQGGVLRSIDHLDLDDSLPVGYAAGDTVSIHVFRRDELRCYAVTLAAAAADEYELITNDENHAKPS